MHCRRTGQPLACISLKNICPETRSGTTYIPRDTNGANDTKTWKAFCAVERRDDMAGQAHGEQSLAYNMRVRPLGEFTWSRVIPWPIQHTRGSQVEARKRMLLYYCFRQVGTVDLQFKWHESWFQQQRSEIGSKLHDTMVPSGMSSETRSQRQRSHVAARIARVYSAAIIGQRHGAIESTSWQGVNRSAPHLSCQIFRYATR